MPRARTHLMINAVAIGAFDAASQQRAIDRGEQSEFNLVRFGTVIVAGIAAGALPDLLEPSRGNPNHRGFFHSLTAAVSVWWLLCGRHKANLPIEARRGLNAAAAGYSLHLGADLLLSAGKDMGIVCCEL